ncbi:MAG TPA: class I adenylate-forming enzyme family protein [Nocardia sp.]|uniref:class I adenylate-forming enzyme family protein n=1 Tax=Nocardia TaxID=1817 RepID=UPI00245732ED|nr:MULTISPECIES: class I adenylate-forming enzyme family protein [Nocardia]HLS77793.1 class I adenylate-forming enzyme family protein [Nocardia sp.]
MTGRETDHDQQTVTDRQRARAELVARLTAKGEPFARAPEDVLGVTMPVFTHRHRSLRAVLAESARLGDREYLVDDERRISYRAHLAEVAALAVALRERHGIGPGDRVAILAANSPAWVQAFWACQCLGAIAVGYNAWWTPREIAYALGHTRPSVVIADGRRAERLAGSGTEAEPGTEAAPGTNVPLLRVEHDVPALIADFAGADLPDTPVDEDDPAVVLYTSGTSGRPKGVTHSHRNLIAVIDHHRFNDAMAAAFAGRVDDGAPKGRRFLLTSPLFHIASLHNLVLPRLATGDTAVFYRGAFDGERVASLIERERITNWGAMPTMAHRLLAAEPERHDLSSLVSLSLNSAPSPATLHRQLRERVPVARTALSTSYGMTECATAATLATPAELAAHPDTVGRPIIGVELQIRDGSGRQVAASAEGEIWVRSPYVMLGYWEDPDATAAAITPDRWLRTGDLGAVDAHGLLRLSGRRSDLVLRGGENVYPTEVEHCLDEHPAVVECAVLGLPDEDLGQRVAAVVVTDRDVTPGELRAFTAERLAYYKVPDRWLVTAEPLPRNATGKVVRAGLAELFTAP